MSRLKRFTVGATVLCTAPFARAEPVAGEIERIYPAANGFVYFRLKGDTCNNRVLNKYYQFDFSHPNGKAWYALLLAASTTGKPIRVAVDGCTAGHKTIDYVFQDF